MGKKKGLVRRTAKFGLLLASLVLALSVPSIALASPVAFFQNVNPAPGSSSAASSRMLSVTVYDRYGVRFMSNMTMSLDGVQVAPTWKPVAGYGFRKFTLKYAAMNMAPGAHTVAVRIHDRRNNTVNYSWSFTVADVTPPVTTTDLLPGYAAPATIHLFASDAGGSGVATTYYKLDGALSPTVYSSGISVPWPPSTTSELHLLEFWSVDVAGNVELHHMINFTVTTSLSSLHALPELACTAVGCHTGNLMTVHKDVCSDCHNGGTLTNNCITCHGAVVHATHIPILSVPAIPAQSCTQAICHGSAGAVAIHIAGCAECHASSRQAVINAIAAGGATCETCHDYAAIHVIPAGSHTVAGACYSALCHNYTDASLIHTKGDDPPGCFVCHAAGITPTLECATPACHPNLVDVHSFVHVSASGTKSSACTACHGTDLPTAHNGVFTGQADLGCFCHTNAGIPFNMAGEMAPLLAAGHAECVDCHTGAHAAHGFSAPTTATSAGGHNTTTYGTVGAHTKFDGSQGPLLTWESEIASASLNATWLVEAGFPPALRPVGITSISVGQEGTVTTTWDFPTVNVFWGSSDASAPASAMKGLTKNSVITCQDCHTGLNLAGPHGEAQNWGIDPNYPGDFSYAELTKLVTTFPAGIKMRSTLTTATQTYTDGASGANAVICAKCHDLENYQSGTTMNSPLPLMSTGSATFVHNSQTYTPVLTTGSRGGWTVFTDAAGNMVPSTPGTSTTPVGAQSWTQSATGTININGIGASNTAHASHHQDQTDGSPQCVGCHIAIPHGWTAPRLLVNTGKSSSGAGQAPEGTVAGDSAPYLSPNVLGTTRNNGGVPMVNGWNKQGMLTLSAVDAHPLTAGSSYPGIVYSTGAAMWSEPSCQGCNEHAGEDGVRIIDPSAAP